MNSDIKTSIMTSVGMIVATILGVLVALGKITPGDASTLKDALLGGIGGIVTLALLLYKLIPHTTANKLAAVAGPASSPTPGVKVTVDPTVAAPALVAVANDTTNAVKVAA